ncbi:hypothetical protein [Pedobacter heparinus]|uniref:Uncharacterized protein n=1 Tax=Pedobacter heparinus (strain ATCC 13125 / DSM 2366 / CIP 104194 / JCM 7457 / NBRC 12017 / NCIMB 9290 / NRRL B-14731 / HIM 762-3) TaxID=485917 RepID=C6XT22_PEDHD|nr:hypothetical protein [Pedobacter heparinus]ACU03583.1 hypothetical protein Phep_1369 [Pedobacter heparinus DSM 2366]
MDTSFLLNIKRLDDYYRNLRFQTGIWSRLLWLDNGKEMIFVSSGTVFDPEHFSQDGWILLFNELFLQDFLQRYPESYNNGLLLEKGLGHSVIPLSESLRKELNDLAGLLSRAIAQGQSELYLQSYADLILLNANNTYAKVVR